MSLLIPDTGLLFWMLVSFGIVLFILVRFAFPTIIGAVDRRREHIAESLTAAEEARRQLDTLTEQGQVILDTAEKERRAVLKDAEVKAAAILERADKEALMQSRQSLARAAAEAAELKKRAISEAMGDIAALSVKIAGKVVEEDLQNEGHMKLIERLLSKETSSNL